MEISLDWKNSIYLSSQLIGCLIGMLLIGNGYKKNSSNIILGFILICLSYIAFIAWLTHSGNFIHFPQLYRTGNLVSLLTIPFIFLYVQTVILSRKINPVDLLHLLPAVLYLVDFWPVFMLNPQEKLKLIESEISDPALFTQYNQSRFFSFNFYTSFRTILLATYWIASLSLIWKYQSIMRKTFTDFGKTWFRWIKIFLGFELLLFLPYLIFIRSADPLFAFELLHFFTAVFTLGAGLSLLFFPTLLYGLNVEKHIEQKIKEKTDTKDILTQQKILEIEDKLKIQLDQQKKFLLGGYSIHNLAMDTGIPGYLLTFYINHQLDSSFSDFINQKRIDEACLLIDSGKYNHLSIQGLAELAGFNNRNSFTQAFQKFKDIPPSAYIKSSKEKTGQ